MPCPFAQAPERLQDLIVESPHARWFGHHRPVSFPGQDLDSSFASPNIESLSNKFLAVGHKSYLELAFSRQLGFC